MGKHAMTQARLRADIEAAKEAISVAEDQLQAVVGEVPGAGKAKVSEVVRAASLKLSDARAKLVDLEASLALAKLESARSAIAEAEKRLDRVLREMVVVASTETTMATKVVRDAFTGLRAAKATLADLESIAADQE